jgi:ABC-type phosphate transport system substrate-binding protein
VAVLGALQSVLEFLGPGNVVLGIALLIATPFVDRFLIRRKRISYRVLYNSKIGLGPEKLHDANEATEANLRQLRQVARLLDRMSIVVVRIRNTGSYDVDPDDFALPLSFTFGRRIVWNARVSEVSDAKLREQIRSGLEFFRDDTTSPDDPDGLRTVRERLVQRMSRWVGVQAEPDLDAEHRWHGVRLTGLSLPRRQRFKLVVVLREPGEGEITKDVGVTGKLKETGLVEDEKRERTITLPRVTGALAAALTLFLVLSLVFAPSPPDPAAARCAAGELTVVGSSVFVPTATEVAEDYARRCRDGRVTTRATGSIDGVRALLQAPPEEQDELAALSDGKQAGGAAELHAEQIAVVVYHVVVNTSAGLNAVSTEQLRGIYDGTHTDWSQLRGGEPLPIRIVGRGQESGTRELFERTVLGTGESGLSSNECLERDRNPGAPAIRCERDSNTEVVREISETPGAIGYADAPSVTRARKENALTALALDGRVFDAAAGVDSGYPFWTVEYLYTRRPPEAGTLLASFLDHVRHDDGARLRLKEAGYLPCTTAEGTALELCDLR